MGERWSSVSNFTMLANGLGMVEMAINRRLLLWLWGRSCGCLGNRKGYL